MEFNISSYKEVLENLPCGIKEAEVNIEKHYITEVRIKGGIISDLSVSQNTAMYARVSGEKTGYAYTEDVSENPQDVITRAYENSMNSEKEHTDRINRMKDVVRSEHAGIETGPGFLAEYAAAMEKGIIEESEIIKDVHVSLKEETVGQHTVNSYGHDINYVSRLYIMRAVANAPENEKIFSASHIKSSKHPKEFNVDEFRSSLEDDLKYQLNVSKKFNSGEYPAILSKKVVYNMFVTAWQIFSGHKYISESSPLSGRLNQKIASECISIFDFTQHPYSGYDVGYDCEGSAGITAKLVEDGMFTGLLHNIATGEGLGQGSTGNAGRRALLSGNIATDILVIPKNFVIQPGEATVTDMQKHMGNGIYITTSSDVFHTINIASGDFSIPCKGVMIRDGKPAENLQSLTISGNIIELLKNVVEVGADLYLSVMENLENFGIGACSLRVSKLMVSGE